MKKTRQPVLKKIPSDMYAQVIECRAPTRWYWAKTESGEIVFDGVVIDCKGRTLTKHQGTLGKAVLEVTGSCMGEQTGVLKVRQRKQAVPKVFQEAFAEERKNNG